MKTLKRSISTTNTNLKWIYLYPVDHAQQRKEVISQTLEILTQFLFALFSLLLDVDECSANQDVCHKDAHCINHAGGYTCACVSGYSGNGTFCEGNLRYFIGMKVVSTRGLRQEN